MVIWFNVSDGGSMMLIFIGVGCFFPLIGGITTYPNLEGYKATAQSLYEEIETMRKTHYSEVQSGELVGGSLDNFKQSTILSEYVRDYAKRKAVYNSSLMSAKARLNCDFFWWLGDTLFMNKEILKMEKL